MLPFCVKTTVKGSHNFELACLKKKKKERNILAFGRLSGLIPSRCFFAPLSMLLVMKHSKMNGTLLLRLICLPF